MQHRSTFLVVVSALLVAAACVVEGDDDIVEAELEDELEDELALEAELEAASLETAASGVDCQCKVGDTKKEWGPNCERLTLTCFAAPCHPRSGNTGMWAITMIEDLPCPPTPLPVQ